jgi:AAA+ superfamily predicted ATPase
MDKSNHNEILKKYGEVVKNQVRHHDFIEDMEDMEDELLEDDVVESDDSNNLFVDEDKVYVSGMKQWSIDGNSFYPMKDSTVKLPSGFYIIKYNTNLGYYLTKRNIIMENVLPFPDKKISVILDDIKMFWKSKDMYFKYGYVYKRGLLMYGPPGCGKTSIIKLVTDVLIKEHDGIVINVRSSDDIYAYDEMMSMLREIEPDRPIIVIIEDVDNFVSVTDAQLVSKVLNILDGSMQLSNVVFLATTNFPERLEERVRNRPSRFDRRVYIGKPSADVRRYYINTKIKKEDTDKIDVEKLVKLTDGYTIDHLKEVVLSVCVLGYDVSYAIHTMNEMMSQDQIFKVEKTETKQSAGFMQSKNN